MRLYVGIVLLLVLGGCAGYKELEPDPPVLPMERGYVELKKDAESFELEKEGKYFIKFPPPGNENFFIVLSTPSRSVLRSSLTNLFDGDDESIVRIPETDFSNDTLIVYPVGPGPVSYYWLIESVPYDLRLDLKYRYVPQWRFSFETKFAGYREVLDWYSVDREMYNSIDRSFDVDRFNLQRELASLAEKNSRIASMMEELRELEEIFPAGITSSRDTAYANYVAFRGKVEEELGFQQLYREVLELFQKERKSRGDVSAFLSDVPYFSATLSQRGRYSQGVMGKACQLMTTRLSEVAPSLDRILINKTDLLRISPSQSVDSVRALFQACGTTIPKETELVLTFVNRFNIEVDGIRESKAAFEEMKSFFYGLVQEPTDSAYTELGLRADRLRAVVPRAEASRMPRFANYGCSIALGREVANTANMADDFRLIFRSSQDISRRIRMKSWGSAEMGLRDLFEAPLASYSPEVQSQRQLLVEMFEENIFSAVKTASHARIDTFIRANAMAIENVPDLYADSAFLPVYRLTFSSGGPAGLSEKRKQIDGYLDGIKHIQFPESSIRSIYASLTKNLNDRGVEKARAVVEHGKFYQGTDNRVKNMIGECNVEVPKLIAKPKEYRKFFALPVSSNPQGENEYMFRLGLRIPSEAEFPVFDVNVKLPQEVAGRAGESQWYESITINNKAIRNEGRFKITSPNAENNYEVLITPVQMDKGERNILEVRFRYPGFRVFEVSAMAQVPIIRKN